jgi:hypothetical protein
MAGACSNETPTEYFKELVETAMERQHVAVRDLTAFYLVNLLTGFVHFDRSSSVAGDEPLGIRLARALQAVARSTRTPRGGRSVAFHLRLLLRQSDAEPGGRRLLHPSGECAYGSLARRNEPAFGEVFDELAGKFAAFVDVLGEVSERSALSSNSDVLRLYEKWIRTRSRRSGDLLVERGIVPNYSVPSRLIQ